MTTVAAVGMVKDEIDVIEYTLRAMANQGVDLIYVADNLSTDGTYELLFELKHVLDCELQIVRDNEVAYYQSEKMTRLAKVAAFDWGHDWIVPFDADEIWCGRKGDSLGEFLKGLPPDVDRADFQLFNYFPRTGDDWEARNPFQRFPCRATEAAPLPKVAIRPRGDFWIHQGNHGSEGWTSSVRGGVVRHFPWRSWEQFLSKIKNGSEAYAATNLPEEQGAHWRGYGRVLREGGPQALHDDVWQRWFVDPDIPMVHDPVDPGLFV